VKSLRNELPNRNGHRAVADQSKIGSAGRNKRPFKLSRLLAEFSILLRNLLIDGFTLFPLSPLSALPCALVVTGIHGAY